MFHIIDCVNRCKMEDNKNIINILSCYPDTDISGNLLNRANNKIHNLALNNNFGQSEQNINKSSNYELNYMFFF